MTTTFTIIGLVASATAGANLSIISLGRGTWINGAGLVNGVAAAIYFAARAHGWSL